MTVIFAACLTIAVASEPEVGADWRLLPANPLPPPTEPVREYLLHLDARLAGPRASPMFRDAVSRAQTAWVLALFDNEMPVFDYETRNRMVMLLGVASAMAAEDYMLEVEQTRDMGAIYSVGRVVGSPKITLRRPGAVPTDAHGDLYEPATPRRAPGFIRTGSSLRVRNLDDTLDLPPVDAAVYVRGTRMGLDAWRISGLALSRQWVVSTRQHLHRHLHVTASARSAIANPEPVSWTIGTLSPIGSWQINTRFTRWQATEERPQEDRVMVELRHNLRWRAPEAPDRPALGSRPGWNGPRAPGTVADAGED